MAFLVVESGGAALSLCFPYYQIISMLFEEEPSWWSVLPAHIALFVSRFTGGIMTVNNTALIGILDADEADAAGPVYEQLQGVSEDALHGERFDLHRRMVGVPIF